MAMTRCKRQKKKLKKKLCRFKIIIKKDEKEKNGKKKFASFLKGREKKREMDLFFHEICPNV